MRQQFGSKASQQDKLKYAESDNWDGKKFVNLEPTQMDIGFQNIPKLLYKQFCEKGGRMPIEALAIQSLDIKAFNDNAHQAKWIWYGHSVVLLQMMGKNILIDPMLGPNAAPISPFPVKRFSKDTLSLIDDFPPIDLLLLTHDHYDHLDLESMLQLKSKVKKYYVALGAARHLKKWGIPEKDITEFDWWQTQSFGDINICYTPTRHFSGRGLSDRASSLWGGWSLQSPQESIWFSGDGGYGQHFKEIGARLGPFDFAFMECGQYNENWHLIHMYPEESVQAAIDAGAQKVMPVHWAGFALAQHHWTDPINRFVAACEAQQLSYISPQLGQIVSVDTAHNPHQWWQTIV